MATLITRPRTVRRPAPILHLERLEDRNLLASTPLAAFDNLSIDPAQYDPSHLIVALRANTSVADISAVAPGIAVRGSAVDLGTGMFRVALQPGVSVAQATAFFQLQAFVRYASPDFIVSASLVPNDPNFSSQWGLHNTGQTGGVADADIDAPEAWDTTTGSGNIVVAVIDTGVDYNHPDLASNIWSNSAEIAGNGLDDDNNGFIDDIRGWDFANNDNNPIDDNGHGSHVAGIIGARGNDGIGVAGVIWNVKIMPVKFLSASGSGSLSNAVLALNYAVANGAKISNNSWGGGGFYQPMEDALVSARAAGHIFVAAAGNASANNDSTAFYPANYNVNNIVSVASTTSSDALSSFSNYGATTVELGAPGSSIYSTYSNGGYATLSGTSMATPFVTGALALVADLHRNDDWTYRQIIDQVLNNTDPIAALSGRTITGGRLNVNKALGGAPPVDSSGPQVTTAVFSGAAVNTIDKLRVTFNEAINASSFTSSDIVSFKRNGTDVTGLTYTVTQVSSTVFDIAFGAQSAVGTYALTIGPNAVDPTGIRDVAGNAMNQNGNATNGEIPADQYTATGSISASQTFNSTDVPKALPDQKTTTSVLSVGPNLSIGSVTVKLNITHTWDSDLKISLKSPGGTTVVLVNRRGGSGDNFTNTVFDDTAAVSIINGAAPFAGTYRPEQALSAFNNQNASGTWSLIVQDRARGDIGTLNSWSITITSAGGGAGLGFSDGRESPSEFGAGTSTTAKLGASIQWFGERNTFHDEATTATPTTRSHQHERVAIIDDAENERAENSTIDVGFVALGATDSGCSSTDWLDFDTGDVLDLASDLIAI